MRTSAAANSTPPMTIIRGASSRAPAAPASSWAITVVSVLGSIRRTATSIAPPHTSPGANGSPPSASKRRRSGWPVRSTSRQSSYTSASTQPPDTFPATFPSSSTASAAPTARGALPCTATTCASAYGRPLSCQQRRVAATSRSSNSSDIDDLPVPAGSRIGSAAGQGDVLQPDGHPIERQPGGGAHGRRDRRSRREGRRLAHAAQPVRRRRVRVLEDLHAERRHVQDRRQQVVGEGRIADLPVLGDDLLQQRQAEALGRSALQLAFE